MTERLYYTDPTILEFDATIVQETQDGGRVMTYCDRSAFYPTSGGQLFDLGTLNDVPVIEIVEDGSGEVAHITAGGVGPIGSRVHGRVDAVRRWKNRQMHTAQHIVSQSFIRAFGLETVSVHLGEDYASVELDAAELSSELIAAVESHANELIAANLKVEILFVPPAVASGMPLRKVPGREGTIRVIKIGEFDWSACGGTHCNRTAEVGLIKIIGLERMRGKTLVKFLSGVQAVADYHNRFETTDRLTRSLSCGVSDLEANIEKLVEKNKSLRREVAVLIKEVTPVRASKMAITADRSGKVPLLVEAILEDESEAAGGLASEVAMQIGGLAAICSGGKLHIAVSETSGLNAGNIAKEFAAILSLRGGGGPRVAQIGGVDSSNIKQYRTIILEMISRV
jgi:alanyl-tRNA synthetase